MSQSQNVTALPTLANVFPHNPLASLSTFVQDRPKDGQAVVDGGAVPTASPELVLALLDAQLHPLGHAGHDLNVVAAEAELLGDEAGDGAAEDGLGPQGAVLLTECKGPARDRGRREGWETSWHEWSCPHHHPQGEFDEPRRTDHSGRQSTEKQGFFKKTRDFLLTSFHT